MNIGDGDWVVFSKLRICSEQELNTFPGTFQRFCLFVKGAHCQKHIVGTFPVLQTKMAVR